MKTSRQHAEEYMRQRLYGQGILGELLHTAWRKGCFADEAHEIHTLIGKMERDEWGNYLQTVIEWLIPNMVELIDRAGWQPVKGFDWEDDQPYVVREDRPTHPPEFVIGKPHATPEMFWDWVMPIPEVPRKEKP